MRRLRAAAWARPKTFWREGIIRLLPPTPSSWRRQILSALVKRVGETKYKKELLSLLRLIFRDALILKTSKINGVSDSGKTGKNRAEKYLMLKSETERLRAISDYYRLNALLSAQEALSEAEKQIRFNGVFPQCLEICMAKILEQNDR